jgi:hypothetical protein
MMGKTLEEVMEAMPLERRMRIEARTQELLVEAAGGTLELRIELPGTGVLSLKGMGELNS